MRIAQLVIAPVARITWDEVRELPARRGGESGGIRRHSRAV
jgi:dUTPase